MRGAMSQRADDPGYGEYEKNLWTSLSNHEVGFPKLHYKYTTSQLRSRYSVAAAPGSEGVKRQLVGHK